MRLLLILFPNILFKYYSWRLKKARKKEFKMSEKWDKEKIFGKDIPIKDVNESYTAYKKYMKRIWDKVNKFSRCIRFIQPYELSKLPDYGDVITLKHFLNCVKNGGFIDYDGFGHYIKDNQETNIKIYPNDVKYNLVRNDFSEIIWYNR